jgi:hypothetical protein
MSNTDSIAQTPENVQFRQRLFQSFTERYVQTGRKPPKQYIEMLYDEDEPTRIRFNQRVQHTINHATITFQGELIKAKTSGLIDRPIDQGSHARKPITRFSPKARKNMLETVSRVDWTRCKAIFITLTYHQIKPDARECKRDLRTFLKRLYRKYGQKAVLWRIEPQKRGAHHFHLIVFNLPFFPIETLLKWWREITGQPTITQCDIQLIHSARKARNYVAKYVGKKDDGRFNDLTNLPGWSRPGRFWGIENRKLITWAEPTTIVVDVAYTLQKFKDCARGQWKGINHNQRAGFALFVHDLEVWKDILWFLFAGINPALE